MARRINLIPRSERPRTRTDWGLLAMVGLFIVVIFALGFGYYMFSNVLDERKQELADLQVQTAALEQQVEALQAVRAAGRPERKTSRRWFRASTPTARCSPTCSTP